MLRIEIFTSVYCVHSPNTINIMKRLAPGFKGKIEWGEFSIETSEGKEKAKTSGIGAVPAIMMDGKIVFVGTPKKEELAQEITKRL